MTDLFSELSSVHQVAQDGGKRKRKSHAKKLMDENLSPPGPSGPLEVIGGARRRHSKAKSKSKAKPKSKSRKLAGGKTRRSKTKSKSKSKTKKSYQMLEQELIGGARKRKSKSKSKSKSKKARKLQEFNLDQDLVGGARKRRSKSKSKRMSGGKAMNPAFASLGKIREHLASKLGIKGGKELFKLVGVYRRKAVDEVGDKTKHDEIVRVAKKFIDADHNAGKLKL